MRVCEIIMILPRVSFTHKKFNKRFTIEKNLLWIKF